MQLRQHPLERLALQVVEAEFRSSARLFLVMRLSTRWSSRRTPKPGPQALLISVAASAMPVPAISRCAQGVLPTKRCRNCAAVIEPAVAAAGVFHVGEFASRSACRRPARAACARASRRSRGRRRSGARRACRCSRTGPACSCPSATRMAPVSVARSTMNCGLKRSWRVPERVGEHEPAFGVGVDDLDGLPGHGFHDVAGALGVAVGHVFDEADDADDVGLRLAGGERVHQAGDAGGAAPCRPSCLPCWRRA